MASSTAVAAADDAAGAWKGGAGDVGGGATPPPSQQQQQPPAPPPPEQGLRCPRCDSPNTKFCYYNNYSLSQPRHFCKTCRRYWTKGGALRNVPVGGGCRKNKRSRSAASASAAVAAASSRLSLNLPVEGIRSVAASADQQQGAAVGMMALPRFHAPAVGHYVPFAEWPSGPGADITGGGGHGSGGHAMNNGHGAAVSSSIASSIESLSFINQDLHWKLQQQRLATMFLSPPSSGAAVHAVEGAPPPDHVGGPYMQMAGAPAMEAVPAATSWFMDSSYVLPSPPTPASTAAAAAIVTATNGNVASGRSSADDDNATSNANNNNSCCSAITAWGDISAFAMLP